ncbi:adenosylmethionine-8-amino-7-oxononanoate aminotransferase [Rhodoblastus acidophilus]|uniref:adenosylmethionine--8-amino-7-oxononanoate transaminase n=1 Tax=Rhodoblastus acidophilus TaxID=1074 RepID=UPI0022245BD6|nr:adenosylmethionine--8-amino-7-oxononanoate transaminase [Rhodoblastus acidophilus]MCW2283133.1 adenosylmethionine-8-amino-7-oxononanoate aminotransferase [Rhodoblastus acidophilus]MCW2331816.1 adenosylmethionine-8-amino-7-oxononanoate aminotransferase [Rhodoblastus acidophilus]
MENLLEHVWLPYTQMKTARQPLQAVSTLGSVITLSDGRELIDGIASWWTACHGYNHPHIVAALRAQLETMPHVMFGGLVHEPALKLAKRLADKAPGDLSKVFFVDSGSVAIEVAMKMAVQYWLNRGVSRSRMVSFRYGYHGDTMACMAVCDPDESMHALFKDYLPKQILAELPVDEASTAEFDALLAREKHNVAAVLIEPLVQGAGGMKMHDATTLRKVAEICRKHEVLLIADEIFVGFGRTGTFFACEQAGVVPDILCVGKGLTGGALTLAAAIARPHVYDAFLSDDPTHALMHGPTYMANPLACAAANASLDLFETEPRLKQVAAIELLLREGLEPCRTLPGVLDVRVKGAIGAVQLETVDAPALREKFAERGFWVRPFGDIVYLTPAFTIEERQLNALTAAIREVLKR